MPNSLCLTTLDRGLSFVRIRQFRGLFFSVLYGENWPLYIRYKLALVETVAPTKAIGSAVSGYEGNTGKVFVLTVALDGVSSPELLSEKIDVSVTDLRAELGNCIKNQ